MVYLSPVRGRQAPTPVPTAVPQTPLRIAAAWPRQSRRSFRASSFAEAPPQLSWDALPPVTDAVTTFLHQIARYPLLNAQQEVELARQIQQRVAITDHRQHLQSHLEQPLTPTELALALALTEQQLEQILIQGQIAQQQMIQANLRLVVSIAKRYLQRGLPFLDLIQEGVLGLHRATEKFDPERGYRFSTYAYWWIRQGITRAIANHSRLIRLPTHIIAKLVQLRQAYHSLHHSLHRPPTQLELATAAQLSLAQLQLLLQSQQAAISLNRWVGQGEETELLDLLEANETCAPLQQTEVHLLIQAVSLTLDRVVTPREKEILTLRFGLDYTPPHSVAEISRLYQLSRDRVRQIQCQALRKLRHSPLVKSLRVWLY